MYALNIKGTMFPYNPLYNSLGEPMFPYNPLYNSLGEPM